MGIKSCRRGWVGEGGTHSFDIGEVSFKQVAEESSD
jgi:hypothetical protein